MSTLPFSSYVNFVVTPMGSVTEDRRPVSLYVKVVVCAERVGQRQRHPVGVARRPSSAEIGIDRLRYGQRGRVVREGPLRQRRPPLGPAATSTSSPCSVAEHHAPPLGRGDRRGVLRRNTRSRTDCRARQSLPSPDRRSRRRSPSCGRGRRARGSAGASCRSRTASCCRWGRWRWRGCPSSRR